MKDYSERIRRVWRILALLGQVPFIPPDPRERSHEFTASTATIICCARNSASWPFHRPSGWAIPPSGLCLGAGESTGRYVCRFPNNPKRGLPKIIKISRPFAELGCSIAAEELGNNACHQNSASIIPDFITRCIHCPSRVMVWCSFGVVPRYRDRFVENEILFRVAWITVHARALCTSALNRSGHSHFLHDVAFARRLVGQPDANLIFACTPTTPLCAFSDYL